MNHKDTTRDKLLIELQKLQQENNLLKESHLKAKAEDKRIENVGQSDKDQLQQLFNEMMQGAALHEMIYNDKGKAVDYRTLDVNKAYESIMVISREQVVGKPASTFIPESELRKWLAIFSPVARGEGPRNYKQYSQVNDKYFEGVAFSPKTGYFWVTFSDFTKRRFAERTLQKSEEKWRKLVETIPSFVALHDPEGRYLFLNHYAEGFSEKDIFGKSLYDFISEDSGGEYRRNFENCLRTKQTQNFIFRGFGNNKEIRIYENYLVPILEKDQIVNVMAIATDITKRKNTEEAFRKLSLRHEAILASVPEIIMEVDNNKVYTWANKAGLEFFGYDVVGKEASYYFRGEQKTYDIVKPLFDGLENIFYLESWQQRYDGESRLLGWWCKVLKDDEGNVTGALSSARDITEQKMAEKALRLEKENFRHSLDDSPLGVRIATNEGNTIYANKTLLDIYGYENLEELQKTPLKDRYTQKSYQEAQKRKQKRKHGDFSSNDYEVSIVRKNGETRILHVFRKEVLWDGTRQFQVICNDITESKRMAKEMHNAALYARKLIEASLDPMVTINKEGKITDVNLATENITGINRKKLIGSDFSVYFTDTENAKKGYRIVFSKGVIKDYPLTIMHKKGRKINILYNASLYKNEAGEIQEVFATARDISYQKKMEGKLLRSKEVLERLNQHLNEVRENERAVISREIHDELGQSMTAMKLDLSRMHPYISANKEAVTKLENMIELISNTIKNVQRISSDLRPGILDDLGLVAAVEWYCDEFEKRTGISCKFKFDDSDFRDSMKNLVLFRVLQETLTNVIRHAMATSVSINLYKTTKGDIMIIQDNGVGIPEEKIESHKSLGLISMRERVRQFGGKIIISSRKGSGTKLSVFIPEKKRNAL